MAGNVGMVTASGTAAERLDALFAPWNRSDAPGIAVGVRRRGQVVYRRGFGMASLEAGQALSPRTRMRIGSTTKHFTALLALLLAEDGCLDLDAPIRRYVAGLEGPGGEPSLRQLLQHRGGSRCYLDLGFIAHGMAVPPPGWALDMQRRQTGRNFPPGEAVIYNNGGYQLVSAAIETAGGAGFGELLRRRLFDPLEMHDTACVPSDFDITPDVATMHVPAPGGGWRRGLFPSEEVSGAGGIVSTVDDMLRWTRHLGERDRFGAPATWAALLERPTLPDGTIGSYALGLMIGHYRGLPVIHHAGGVIGGSSQMILFPEHGLEVVVLCNGAPGADPIALAERVADILLEDVLGPPTPRVAAAPHRDLLGTWWSPETGMVYGLQEVEGDLRLTVCGSPPMVLEERDGRAVAAVGSLGDMTLDLDAAREGGALPLRFGTRTGLHHRLTAGPAAVAALADSAPGTYRSEDADCTARITARADGVTVVLSDLHGSRRATLEVAGPRVAIARSMVGSIPFAFALSFDDGPGPAAGFIVNTTRTRFLRFDRVAT